MLQNKNKNQVALDTLLVIKPNDIIPILKPISLMTNPKQTLLSFKTAIQLVN